MKSNSSKKPNDPASQECAGTGREAIIDAVRRAVKAHGGRRITFREFLACSGMLHQDIYRNFAGWEETLQAAGFNFKPHREEIALDCLMADWGAVARDVQRVPTRAEFILRGTHAPTTFAHRFGGWGRMPDAFRTFATGNPEWTDVLALLDKPRTNRRRSASRSWRSYTPVGGKPAPEPRHWVTARKRRADKSPIYGEPLDFEGMRHAPVNEAGVIFLFGIMAARLGFLVELLRPNFPDCEAKRRIGRDEWDSVRIEFEYESRNFKQHAHNPEACDLIVCWTHNWPECPLEVIALKDELARLRPGSSL